MSQTGLRLEVQGLRAVAVTFVLLFHLWQRAFPFGYLGVDVFFVISGYFMCQIMSKSGNVTLKSAIDFYFRRIKRIVPIYMVYLAFTLVLTRHLVAPIEYVNIVKDGVSAGSFVSNWALCNLGGYFDVINQFSLFTHTWSLSVEMQFYLIVPPLFALGYLTSRLHRWGLYFTTVTLIVLSLGTHWTMVEYSRRTRSLSYYATYTRVWQFLLGFLSFFWYKKGAKESERRQRYQDGTEGNTESKSDTCNSKLGPIAAKVLPRLTLLLLVISMSIQYTYNDILPRVVSSLLAAVFLSQHDHFSLLSTAPLTSLGDISYSVYLVHWPILSMHRYWQSQSYEIDKPQAPMADGFCLMFVSVLVGHLLENGMRNLVKGLTNWFKLALVVSALYLTCAGLMSWLAIADPHYYHRLTTAEQVRLRKTVEHLYLSPHQTTTLSKKAQIQLNAQLWTYSVDWNACKEQDPPIPTALDLSAYQFSWKCADKGRGEKTVVVVGNSHARELLPGLQHHLKDVYGDLFVLCKDLCTPFAVDAFERDYPQNECAKFKDVWLPLLRNWNQPIDAIIFDVQFLPFYDPPLLNLTSDPYLNEMQEFVDGLASIARDTVLLPKMHMDVRVEPLSQVVQQRLHFDRGLDLFVKSRKELTSTLPNIRKRIELVDCAKCRKMDFEACWCDESECRMVDEREVVYFRDARHVNAYGSLLYGKMIRNLYLNATI